MPPGSLLQRPGNTRDEDDDKLNPANRLKSGGSEGAENPGSSWVPDGFDQPYPGDDIARPNLAKSEKNAQTTDGISSPELSKPEANLSAPAPIKTTALAAATQGKKVLFRIKGVGVSRKQAGGAAGATGVLVFSVLMYLAGASTYLVNLKNYVTGPHNDISYTVGNNMQRRRTNSLMRLLKSSTRKIQADQFVEKAAKAGITVVKDGNKIIKIVGEGGEIILEGKSSRQIVKQISALSKGDDAGRLFLGNIDNISKQMWSRFGGPVMQRNVLRRYLGIFAKIDFIKTSMMTRAPPEGKTIEEVVEAADPNKALAQFLAGASDEQLKYLNSLPAERLVAELGLPEGTVVPEGAIDDILKQAADEAPGVAGKASGELGQGVLKTAQEADASSILEQSGDIVGDFGAAAGASDEVAQGLFKNLASKLSSKILEKAGKAAAVFGADPTSLWRLGCRTVGTLEFVKSVRNTLLAIELAKFAVRFYTIADHQQAGLASSTSVKLMSIFLQGATGSSGVQSMVNGGQVSGGGLTAYSTGYGEVGILAAIGAFMRSVPGLDPGNCKIAVNPLTQVAGTLTGGALAALSFGSTTAIFSGVGLSTAIGMTVANEIAFGVVTPILIASVTGSLISGFEKPGEQTGNLLASSVGALNTMSDGASAGLPVPQDVLVGMIEEEKEYRKLELGQQSIAERYLNINNPNSMVARASLYMPQTLPGLSGIAQKQFSASSVLSPFSSVLSIFSKPASAVTNSCEDIAIQKYGAATDGFCNPVLGYAPVLDLDQTKAVLKDDGQITDDDQPVAGSDFSKFIENCFSGRPGIMHPINTSTDGTTDPIDPTCVPWESGGVDSEYIANDLPEEVEYGEPERTPTRKERYAAWYGYLVDEENYIQDINGDFGDITDDEETAGNNSIYVIGDSLTVGMNTAGDLTPKLTENGWNVSKVNAVGGEDLSWGVDQLVRDASIVEGAGAVLVGLGTNNIGNYPGSMDKVKEQMQEIIDIINPPGSATKKKIYWTDFYGEGTLTTRYGSFDLQQSYNAPDGLNAVLKEVAQANGVQILPWSTSTEAPQFVPANDVHPNGRYPEMATFIANAIGNAPKGVGASATGAAQVGAFKMNIQRDPATSCPGIEQPGAKEIQRYVNSTWGGGTGYITNCREVSTGGGSRSVHSEGRAVDSSFNALSPTGLDNGNKTFEWLLTNAEAIGLQYIKFWRVQWSPKNGISCVTSKDDQANHSTHIHYELNWAGARQETPYFSNGAIADSAVTINQEICPRL